MATQLIKQTNGQVLLTRTGVPDVYVYPTAFVTGVINNPDKILIRNNNDGWEIYYSDVTLPVTGSRDLLITELGTNFFFDPAASGGGGTSDVNIVSPDPLPTKITQDGIDTGHYAPLQTDGKYITAIDVDYANSNFTGWTGTQEDHLNLFRSPFSASIANSSGAAKFIEIALKNTTGSVQVALGENNGGTFQNVIVEAVGSGGSVRTIVPEQLLDPNTTLNVEFEADVFNLIRITFNTTNTVSLSNISIGKVQFVSAQIQGKTDRGQFVNVGVTPFGELKTQQQRDIFGNLPVADQFSIHDNSRVFEQSIALFWTDLIIGAAANTYDKATSKSTLSVTNNGDVAATQLKHRKKYQPLKAHKTATTGLFTQEAGVEKYVGLFDLDNYGDPVVDGTIYNGVPIKITEGNVFVQIWNNGVLAIEAQQSDWNIDKLDGNGVSGIALDLSYAQILVSEIEWLGVGSVLFIVNIDGQNVAVHRIDNANERVQGVYMRTANLPVCYMIKSVGGTGTMDVICNAVVSGGGHNPTGVPFVVENLNTISIADENYEALLFIRLKPDSYEGTVDITGISGLVESSGDSIFRLLFNPTWDGGTLTWIGLPNSHIEYAYATGNNDILAEGRKMKLDYVSSDSDSGASVVESDLRLGKELQANANQLGRYDILCLAAFAVNSNEIYVGAISGNDVF